MRHGESIGNTDASTYGRLPDNQQPLTDWGKEQAVRAGKRLRNLLTPTQHQKTSNHSVTGDLQDGPDHEDVRFFVSPYKRSHQTFHLMSDQLESSQFSCVEDPRLREQDWGNFQDIEHMRWQMKERRRFGVFYYRFADGESGADVYDRVSSFMETLCRDSFRSKPTNYVLVSHGITVRMFLARFYHWPVDVVNKLHNFYNGQMVVLERSPVTREQYTNVHMPERRFIHEHTGPNFYNRKSLNDPFYATDDHLIQTPFADGAYPDAENNPENMHEKMVSGNEPEICGTRFLLTSLLMSDPPGPPEQDIWWEKVEEMKKTTSPLLGL